MKKLIFDTNEKSLDANMGAFIECDSNWQELASAKGQGIFSWGPMSLSELWCFDPTKLERSLQTIYSILSRAKGKGFTGPNSTIGDVAQWLCIQHDNNLTTALGRCRTMAAIMKALSQK